MEQLSSKRLLSESDQYSGESQKKRVKSPDSDDDELRIVLEDEPIEQDEEEQDPGRMETAEVISDSEIPSTSSDSTSVNKWSNVFPIRAGDGRLKLIPMHGKRVLEEKEPEKTSLLSRPFWDLFLDAEADLARRAEAPVTHLDTSEEPALPEGYEDVEFTRPGGRRNPPAEIPDQLWTDKYRPKGFMDLLSDTGLNRTVLQWMKLWDECVFNKPVKKAEPKKEETNQKGNYFRNRLPELDTELDKWRRPMQPVILLAGPPGLGKTTLAHVLARHSGYNAVELNASDDRSPEAFRTALEASTQMKAVLDKESRPNCLVIDEIDGAPTQSIAVLLQMLRPEPSEKGKKKKRVKVLLRPVICICNDPWVPALRQLRQAALLIQIPSTQTQRLVSRLQDILRKERMKFDPSALQALSEKTDNDIRSCLSTLQFLHSKKKMITLTDVASLNVGDKDTQHSLSNVLYSVFMKPRDSQASSTKHRRQNPSVTMLAQSFSDYERLNQGLFDTYVTRIGRDSDLSTIIPIGLEWLAIADQMQSTIQRTQNYSLMAYACFTASRFHSLFATIRGTKPVFNNSYAEHYQNLQRLKHHQASLLSFISPSMLSFHSGVCLLLDILPFIVGLIQPQMKSCNIQLLNDEDRKKFRAAIDVMLSFGLVYQQRINEGQYSFLLEPNIEEIVNFPGITSAFTPLTYPAKLMFSRELELQKVRHSDEIVSTKSVTKAKVLPTAAKAKAVPLEMKQRKDFFGRIIPSNNVKPEATVETTEPKPTGRVYYKFKEGFSNAVRRNIKMRHVIYGRTNQS